jgi:hypothetical protein
MPDEQPRFHLVLRSEPSSVPVEVRLRRALKTLLRGLRLRVEKCALLPQDPGPDRRQSDRP